MIARTENNIAIDRPLNTIGGKRRRRRAVLLAGGFVFLFLVVLLLTANLCACG